MSIIISRQGKDARKVDASRFESEDDLQQYIHENPESIPVYEIEEDKRLFVVAREFETGSGPIDALAIDKDGDIYIVETKLYKNSDKRYVVAQALDYGASLWKHLTDFGEFMLLIDQAVHEDHNLTFEEKTKQFFGLENIQSILDNMKLNLRDGNIKFVILMDSIDERLKDLIIYINQNSQFDIYAVQLEYYKFEEYEIMIPRLFGAEVKKNIGQNTASKRQTWTEETIIEDMQRNTIDERARSYLLELYDFTKKYAGTIELGSGKMGSFTFKFEDVRSKSGLVSVFTIYSDGSCTLTCGNIMKRLGQEASRMYVEKISRFDFMHEWKPGDMIQGYSPSMYLQDMFKDMNAVKEFETAVLDFIKEVKV